MMSEKYFHLRKRQNILAKTLFSQPVEVTGYMNFKNILGVIVLPISQRYVQELERNWNN